VRPVSPSVVQTLAAQGGLIEAAAPVDAPYPRLDPAPAGNGPVRGPARRGRPTSAPGAGSFGVTLLKGVTGSGKTEVYMEAVAACLRAGRQALVLCPRSR
jgi:primosomal protein N' (replication factor Y) (superfamily II helicase)